MDNKAQEKLQTLIIAYTKNLPNKIQEIENEWLALSKQFNMDQFVVFHRNVHSLCGSAGTYGYSALSKAARELETFLKPLLSQQELTSEKKNKITSLLEQIKEVAMRGSSEIQNQNFELEETTNNWVYLLTQDDELNSNITENLTEANYQVKSSQSLIRLKEMVQRQKPCVILVDAEFFNQPDYQLLAGILKENTSIHIFCIAQNSDLLTRLQAVRLGCSSFFSKPVDTFYLIKAINRISGAASDPVKILIVDDSPALADYYSTILTEAGLKTHTVNQPLNLMEVIAEFQPDLILMDMYMPECTGIELVELMRQDPIYGRIPVIFLSAEDDKFKQLSALSKGGDLFLTKPILPQHLIAAVKSCAKRAGFLNSFIAIDSLTGLLNHAHILKYLEIEFARAVRHDMPLTFVMIDIDYFKKINDQFGHLAGDRVLKRISHFLQKNLRKSDFVGRYGGEEFAVIHVNQTAEEVFQVYERIKNKFNEIIFTENHSSFSVTFSSGIASYPDVKTPQELAAIADKMLYNAKKQGRNKIISYNPK